MSDAVDDKDVSGLLSSFKIDSIPNLVAMIRNVLKEHEFKLPRDGSGLVVVYRFIDAPAMPAGAGRLDTPLCETHASRNMQTDTELYHINSINMQWQYVVRPASVTPFDTPVTS